VKLGLALLGFAAALLGGGAFARNQPGRSGHSTGNESVNTQAFTELSAFGRCFPPTFNVRLNAQWIRYLLAEALLRLSPAS